MRRTMIAALAGSLLTLPLAGAALAQDSVPVMAKDMTLLTISATGETKADPDIATISAGVVTQSATANEAMRENRTRMDRVIAALTAAGVDEKDIQTDNLNLNPQYRYAENEPPQITGYQAQNTVSLTLRDIANAGAALDALVAEGANQINGPTFGMEDSETAMNEARIDAMRNARARADIYAQAAGMQIARIVSISESSNYAPQPPRPQMMRSAAMDQAEASTKLQPGQLDLTADVTVIYELR